MDSFADLALINPEITLTLASFMLLLIGVFHWKKCSPCVLWFAQLSLLMTLFWLCYMPSSINASAFSGMVVLDAFSLFVKKLSVIASMLVLLLSSRWLTEGEGKPFEFVLLILFSTIGLMIMMSAGNLLSLYVGLELSSLALYVLAAFNRDDAKSTEAGLKYFVLGALASGMLLFGASLVYGFTGTTDFSEIAGYFASFTDETAGDLVLPKAAVIGMVFIMIGFCFKISAVPFHMWTPDVYEGAPTPVTAFFAAAPKIAAIALFTRVMWQPFGDLIGYWQQIVIFASLASMIVGALGALTQTNIKRLLAYSSIGHVGFMLMGLAAGSAAGVQGMLVYLTLYIFMSVGAFGCVLLMRRGGVYVEEIRDLAGVSERMPGFAILLSIFMFSMAGIPPLAGFFGKMYVVLAAIQNGLIWLAVAGLLTSVISCYYYLKVVKVMYFDEMEAPLDRGMPMGLRIAIGVGAVVTMLFFLVPDPLINQAKAAAIVLIR